MGSPTRQERREKAERTTGAAVEIIRKERAESEAKTARLKALRAERDRTGKSSAEGAVAAGE